MKILLTGNMGYVGSVAGGHLRAAFPEARIAGFDSGYFAPCLTGTTVPPESILDAQHRGDVRTFDPGLLAGTDAVVHLAAISNDPIGNAYSKVTYQINHEATVRLATLARAAGVRSFVFASSCSLYGFASDRPRHEQSALDPLTPYAQSKALAERDLRELATSDFQVTSLRFATACGMSPRLRLDLVLNDFLACAVAGQTITVLSDGTPWRPLIDVSDMARAIEWAITREAAGAEPGFLAVNVGADDWNFRIRELAAAVAERVEGARVSINDAAPPDRRSYRVEFGLFRRLAPAHQPVADLDATIRRLRDGLRAMNFQDAAFRDSGLMRINHLNRLRAEGALDPALHWTKRLAA